jgi:hypothetical protein
MANPTGIEHPVCPVCEENGLFASRDRLFGKKQVPILFWRNILRSPAGNLS